VAPFSGGEKARLVLALVAYLRPNLMLLDEPTNHLDLEMRQALTVALQDYEGAVVLVSHDRHLLRTVADQFYIVHGGRVAPFDGDLEDYARWLADGAGAAGAQVAAVDGTAADAVQTAQARKQRKREEAERRNRLSPLKAELARWERELELLARERTEIETELAAPELYTETGRERLQELLARQGRLEQRVRKAEAAWMEAGERLEAATS
jgi:ATP-binding cassette subfamily F protein 3